jgi:hypothetical protein
MTGPEATKNVLGAAECGATPGVRGARFTVKALDFLRRDAIIVLTANQLFDSLPAAGYRRAISN